ncbi:MAG: catalase [Mycobacterium sp.]|nr:catalase [Mycobacterium sp.]
MSNDPKAPEEAERQRLRRASTPARFAPIGVALAAVVGTFAYIGGWLTPKELSPARLTDAFEQVDGVHPGFRRNHAKGLGVSGFFESNGSGVRLSKAVVFRPERLPVIGRFSLSGGRPDAADMPNTVRGLGLEFSLPDGERWRTAMINLPVFPVSTPEAFYERLIASTPDPKTGKPDPAQMKPFLARHPESEQAMKVIRGQAVSSGFGNSTFHSLNAFRLMNAAGDSIPVRWLMTPEQPFEAAGVPAAAQDKNYLFDALIAQIRRQPLR